jgi:hypothetical protein
MSTKKISINPQLFSSNKTNKRRENSVNIKPLISPNILKNKLMSRIKSFKQEEMKKNQSEREPVEIGKYSDEFHNSLDYLQQLSQLNKYKKQKNNTIKNRTNTTAPHVELDLPDSLKEPTLEPSSRNYPPMVTIQSTNPNPIYQIDNMVPYGILKGGVKPTYRQWTQKVRPTSHSPNTIQSFQPMTEREKKLQLLKQKFKQNTNPIPVSIPTHSHTPNPIAVPTYNSESFNKSPNFEEESYEPLIKKTITKKYTLGKSKNNRTVSILLKDRNTRKQIVNEQKEIKRKSVKDMKKYLRDHNIIRIGSNSPNEVIRQMYESSILAGDIINHNKDILLHNLSTNLDE